MDNAEYSIMNSRFKEEDWVLEISSILEQQDLENYSTDVPVCIFQVPKSLSSFKPESYIPQLVGLGPFHHLRPELYQREIDKLAAGKRAHKEFQLMGFEDLVAKIEGNDQRIRKCYEKYFNFRRNTLAWMMVVDGLLLLDYLHSYVPPGTSDTIVSSSAANFSGRKPAAQDLLLRDLLMLENQIPLLVLKEMAENCSTISDQLRKSLPSILVQFCQANSPIELEECKLKNAQKTQMEDEYSIFLAEESCEAKPTAAVLEHLHLLDIIYNQQVSFALDLSPYLRHGLSDNDFARMWGLAKNLDIGFIQLIKKPVDLVLKVLIRLGVSISCFEEALTDNTLVPTVSQLSRADMKFCSKNGSVRSVDFNKKTKTLYLPVMNLNVNSDVIIRNLVAYEAMAKPELMIFTRFTELMNGLIDAAEDVELLKKEGIIKSKLESKDIAELFNGMSKSIDAKGKTPLEKTIKDVNEYYDNIGTVKTIKLMKRYVYTSWKILTVLATILFLFLTALQTFCTVYTCHHIFITDNTATAFASLA